VESPARGSPSAPLGWFFVPAPRPEGDRSNWTWRADDGRSHSGGRAVIFDIDGVLSNAAGRQHFLEHGRRDWASFFEACGDDPVIEEVARLLELLDASLTVILLTGRPHRVHPQTVAWLKRYGLRWDLLVMRSRGDYAQVTEFKQSVVEDLRVRGFDLQLAFEDDPSNHAMYVAAGVPCVYIHSGYYG
jgi:putative acid phosphatase of HAD superfamily subfamily IIIB